MFPPVPQLQRPTACSPPLLLHLSVAGGSSSSFSHTTMKKQLRLINKWAYFMYFNQSEKKNKKTKGKQDIKSCRFILGYNLQNVGLYNKADKIRLYDISLTKTAQKESRTSLNLLFILLLVAL